MTAIQHTTGSTSATSSAGSQPTSDPQPINALDKAGMGILALISLAGLWMIVAPFLVDYQRRGADWTSGTTNDVVIGIVLAVLPLIALIVLIGGSLGEIARTARRRASRAA